MTLSLYGFYKLGYIRATKKILKSNKIVGFNKALKIFIVRIIF